MRAGRVRVVVFRPAGWNRWDEVDLEDRHVIRRCAVAPGNSTEPGEWANSVETECTLLAPFDADVRSNDEVEIEGLVGDDGKPIRWQVIGDPARWRHPTARRGSGITVALRRVGG